MLGRWGKQYFMPISAMGFSFYTPVEIKIHRSIIMIENEYQYIKINHPEIRQQLQHISEHPGDPLYNSLIVRGDIFAASCAFKNLAQALKAKYPGKEILYHDKNSFAYFIKKSDQLYLDNF